MKFEPTESDYNEYVELVTPTSSVPRNCLWAFLVGGVICTIGQGIFDLLVHFDVKEDEGVCVCIADTRSRKCHPHKSESLQEDSKVRRCRSTCADHRICKWCVCAHSGIPD